MYPASLFSEVALLLLPVWLRQCAPQVPCARNRASTPSGMEGQNGRRENSFGEEGEGLNKEGRCLG